MTLEVPGSGREYAIKFEKLLEMYPRPDGGMWRGRDFHEATNGFVSKSYITNLRKGRGGHPGIAKLKEIAEVMGFPFRLWIEPTHNWEMVLQEESGSMAVLESAEFEVLLKRLLDVRTNSLTGKPYTIGELAAATHGKLSEDDIDRMLAGHLENPTRKQLIALSEAFGVDPAYWFKRSENNYVFEPDTYDALKETQNQEMLKRSLSLSSDDKELVMNLLEKLHKAENQGLTRSDDES